MNDTRVAIGPKSDGDSKDCGGEDKLFRFVDEYGSFMRSRDGIHIGIRNFLGSEFDRNSPFQVRLHYGIEMERINLPAIYFSGRFFQNWENEKRTFACGSIRNMVSIMDKYEEAWRSGNKNRMIENVQSVIGELFEIYCPSVEFPELFERFRKIAVRYMMSVPDEFTMILDNYLSFLHPYCRDKGVPATTARGLDLETPYYRLSILMVLRKYGTLPPFNFCFIPLSMIMEEEERMEKYDWTDYDSYFPDEILSLDALPGNP